jgi:hypothetical protein
MAQWAGDLSQDVRRQLRMARKGPSEATIRRVLDLIDPEKFERKIGQWSRRHGLRPDEPIAVDGKTVRGSANGSTPPVQLVSAIGHHSATVVAQTAVPEGTNEIATFKEVLKDVPLQGRVVTADAAHTQVKSAKWLVETKKADYVFMVKDNQRTLKEDIEAVDWSAFPPSGPDDR